VPAALAAGDQVAVLTRCDLRSGGCASELKRPGWRSPPGRSSCPGLRARCHHHRRACPGCHSIWSNGSPGGPRQTGTVRAATRPDSPPRPATWRTLARA
jgi:hypothetical protein